MYRVRKPLIRRMTHHIDITPMMYLYFQQVQQNTRKCTTMSLEVLPTRHQMQRLNKSSGLNRHWNPTLCHVTVRGHQQETSHFDWVVGPWGSPLGKDIVSSVPKFLAIFNDAQLSSPYTGLAVIVGEATDTRSYFCFFGFCSCWWPGRKLPITT